MTNVLSPREGYRLWAPTYATETAVTLLEQASLQALDVSTKVERLLDVGCGTARRLRQCHARLAVGVDVTMEMLERSARAYPVAAADVRALPLPPDLFDVVWCRLVIGHVRNIGASYAELARVCRPGGRVVVTDFHPDAVAAGHRRSFRDERGVAHTVEHHVHSADAQCAAARQAGLALVRRHDGAVGPLLQPLYEEAGRGKEYQAQRGLNLVLALAFEKVA